jgi:hypothetical protein
MTHRFRAYTKNGEALLAIMEDLGVPIVSAVFPVKIVSLRSSADQKSAGAMSWVLIDIFGQTLLSSSLTVKGTLKAYKEGRLKLCQDTNPYASYEVDVVRSKTNEL